MTPFGSDVVVTVGGTMLLTTVSESGLLAVPAELVA